MKKNTFEICVYNSISALNAQLAGADRIELCDNMYEGGTTPSYGMIKIIREKLKIEINVMIRPRGGDFCYDDTEFEIMKNDILKCKELKVNGVVFGILKSDGNIDIERTSELTELARPLSVTFHRAFDMTPDLFKSMDELALIGIDRILTSGGQNTATEGVETIKKLILNAKDAIIIMPGSGINSESISKISDISGANEFHLSGKMPVNSEMLFRKTNISMSGIPGIDEYVHMVSNKEIIKQTINAIKQ